MLLCSELAFASKSLNGFLPNSLGCVWRK